MFYERLFKCSWFLNVKEFYHSQQATYFSRVFVSYGVYFHNYKLHLLNTRKCSLWVRVPVLNWIIYPLIML